MRRLFLGRVWLVLSNASPLLWATVGEIRTVAGDGDAGFSGDNGAATAAKLNVPTGIALDSNGNLYIADTHSHRIRKVDMSGNITTVAGTGEQGISGDGGAATAAKLSFPYGVAVDSNGGLYIADTHNHCIRKVDEHGRINTVAGNGIVGFSGDGGDATVAQLCFPYAVAVNTCGSLYIADTNNHRIRKVDSNGNISTVAGNGNAGFSGDGGVAIAAKLNYPHGVVVDDSGNFHIVDTGNSRIRKVEVNGYISTVAGNGDADFDSETGVKAVTQLSGSIGVALDKSSNLYIADYDNARIRKVGVDNTLYPALMGETARFSSDIGAGIMGVALDNNGNIYIADTDNHCIRKIAGTKSQPSIGHTDFRTSIENSRELTIAWVDATGASLPEGYLILCHTRNHFTAASGYYGMN